MSVVADVLEYVGVEVASQAGERIRGRCPVHYLIEGTESRHGDSFSIDTQTGLWYCHSCHEGGDVFKLMSLLDVPISFYWSTDSTLDYRAPSASSQAPVPCDPVVAAKVAALRLPSKGHLRQRKITSEVCERFGVKWDPDSGSWVFPVEASDGTVMGYHHKGSSGVWCTPGTATGSSLFGLAQARSKVAMVLESPIDVLRYYSMFGGDVDDSVVSAVATYGAHVTSTQDVILRDSFSHIIMAYDNDDAGWKANYRYANSGVTGFTDMVVMTYEGPEKDIGELDDDDLALAVSRSLFSLRRLPW